MYAIDDNPRGSEKQTRKMPMNNEEETFTFMPESIYPRELRPVNTTGTHNPGVHGTLKRQ